MRENLGVIFSYFSLKPYVVTPHLNHLEMVQMRGHNICFMQNSEKLSPIIIKYSLLSRALKKIIFHLSQMEN